MVKGGPIRVRPFSVWPDFDFFVHPLTRMRGPRWCCWLRERDDYKRGRDGYKCLAEQLQERCALLERGLVGKKGERLCPDDAQLSLAVLGSMLAEQDCAAIDALAEAREAQEQVIKEHTRKKSTGRRPLPEHLTRVVIEMVPDVVQQESSTVSTGARGN